MEILYPPAEDAIRETVLTSQGDIIQRGAAVAERLGIGAIEQFLKVNAAGNALEYGRLSDILRFCNAGSLLALNIPRTILTKVALDNAIIDPESMIDTVNDKVIPNKAGYYFIYLGGRYDSFDNGNVTKQYIYINGVSQSEVEINCTSGEYTERHMHTSCFVYLNGTTDYIEVYTEHTSVADRNYVLSKYTGGLIVLGGI
jgi:hypothetical protein